MKKLIILFYLILIAYTTDAIPPDYVLKSSGSVTDFVIENDLLYACTDVGIVDIFDINNKKKIKTFSIHKITDFTGNIIPAKIFSIDKLSGINEILLCSQGSSGFRNVYIYKNEKLEKIFDSETDKLMIKRAMYIDENLILIGLLSNEIILYNIKEKKQIYRKHLSTSVFSNFILDESRNLIITCEESGTIRLLNSHKGETIKTYSGQNVDNIYKVDYSSRTFIAAGQDRRVSIYHYNNENNYYIEADFLIYCVGLSSDAKYGAYLANENNDIFVFDTETKKILHKLQGQKSTQTKIYFYDNNTIISSSEDPEILIWKL